MKIFKKYNLGLTKKAYFKLNKILNSIEERTGEKLVKSHLINKIILDYEITKTKEIDLIQLIEQSKNENK